MESAKNFHRIYHYPNTIYSTYYKSLKTAKVRLMRSLFDDFKMEMEDTAFKYGLELEKNTRYYSYEDKQHEKFYDCYSTYPGLNYVVKKANFQKDSLQMWFRIEVEHNLFAEIIEEAAQYLSRDTITSSDWWFTWCYPNGKRQDDYYDDVPDFKNMNQCAIRLVDVQERKKFVQNTVKVFDEHLLKYLLNI